MTSNTAALEKTQPKNTKINLGHKSGGESLHSRDKTYGSLHANTKRQRFTIPAPSLSSSSSSCSKFDYLNAIRFKGYHICTSIHDLIHSNRRLFRYIDETADDSSRDTHSDTVSWKVRNHKSTCSDLTAFSNRNWSQNSCSRAQQYPLSHCRMTDHTLFSRSPERDMVQNTAIVTNGGLFSEKKARPKLAISMSQSTMAIERKDFHLRPKALYLRFSLQ